MMEEKEKEYDYPELGEELRFIQKKLNISQKEVAAVAGMSLKTLQDCFKGGIQK